MEQEIKDVKTEMNAEPAVKKKRKPQGERECDCGLILTVQNFNKHRTTKVHWDSIIEKQKNRDEMLQQIHRQLQDAAKGKICLFS